MFPTYTTPWSRWPSHNTGSPRYTSSGYYGVSVSLSLSSQNVPQSTRRRSFSGETKFNPTDFACRPRPTTSRSRRNSTSAQQPPRPARRSATPYNNRSPPPPRQATEADATRHKIPAGYSLKDWDPNEEPIVLLGSVFDANSLGKWIYDWTVYHHGAGSPIGEMAGELWLLLIQLAGKMKRAEEIKITSKVNREMIEEFIEAGEHLTDKLRKLLKTCEAPMLRSGSKQKKEGQLGKSAGVDFVETLFGADRELESTQRFMTSVRLWNLQFDTNCEGI